MPGARRQRARLPSRDSGKRHKEDTSSGGLAGTGPWHQSGVALESGREVHI